MYRNMPASALSQNFYFNKNLVFYAVHIGHLHYRCLKLFNENTLQILRQTVI